MECFGPLFGDWKYRRIGWTVVDEGQPTEVVVSTVWIGTDMSFAFGREPHVPLIFETMAFLAKEPESDYALGESVYCERWPTEAAALAGHDQAVEWVKDKLFFKETEHHES